MSSRVLGLVTDTSAANATAFPRVELNPANRTIDVIEFGISMNGAPNSTLAPVDFRVYRNTLVGTGSAGTMSKLRTDIATSIDTTALVECSAIGAGTVTTLHQLYVPVVSGVIWVAAPDREFDCIAAEFIGIQNNGALGASINANVYMIFAE